MQVSKGLDCEASGRLIGLRPILDVARRAVIRVVRWQELSAQRRALRKLDDHMIKDLGLDRAKIEYEATRPFWDDPLDRAPSTARCANGAPLRA